MHVVDRRGRELTEGALVETHRGRATIARIAGGPPPIVYLQREGAHPIHLIASVDVNDPPATYRCNQAELIDPEEEN